MGKTLFDDETMEVPCPQCGRKLRTTARKLKRNDVVTCACGAEVRLRARFDKAFQAVAKNFEGFPKTRR